MADVKMVVVDGVRYREEDAPEAKVVETKKAPAPVNKARASASNKKG